MWFIRIALASTAPAVPTFEDCRVHADDSNTAIRINLGPTRNRQYEGRLSKAAKGANNFAGPFVLATWDCGAGCVMGAAIDRRDGHVVWLPFSVSDWPSEVAEPLAFRRDSCLLVVRGRLDEKRGGTHYFRFDGERFEPWEAPAH